jgi:hypothetical protein
MSEVPVLTSVLFSQVHKCLSVSALLMPGRYVEQNCSAVRKAVATERTHGTDTCIERLTAAPLHATEALGGERRYSSYSFSTSALDGVSGQRHAPAALYPQVRTPGTHCTGGWVGPRASLDTEARGKILSPLPGIEPQSPLDPSRSQTRTERQKPEIRF